VGAIAGCLPIRYSYLELPEIVGVYRDSGGRPTQGSFAIAMGRLGDSTCTTTTLRATTDSNGLFRFPRQEFRSKWTPSYHSMQRQPSTASAIKPMVELARFTAALRCRAHLAIRSRALADLAPKRSPCTAPDSLPLLGSAAGVPHRRPMSPRARPLLPQLAAGSSYRPRHVMH
jgi:hypothetical protein